MTLKNTSRLICQTLLFLSFAGTGPVLAEHLAYSAQNEVLTELRFQNGNLVSDDQTWTFPSVGQIYNIDRYAGTLYFMAIGDPSGHEILFAADLEAGTASEVRNFGTFNHVGISFDDDGVLWILTGTGDIYSYDPSTDAETLVTTLIASEAPAGAAWHDGRLHVLLQSADLESGPIFGAVDLSTGNFSEQRELPGLVDSESLTRGYDSIDFDDAGGLWIGGIDSFGLIDPPTIGWMGHFEDPWQDSEPAAVSFVAPYRSTMPVSVSGRSVPIAVPTANALGLMMLTGLLMAAAVFSLRSRRGLPS